VSSALGGTANFALDPPSCSLSVVSNKIALRKRRKSPVVDLKLPAAAIKGLKHGRKESVSITLAASNANGAGTARASARRLRGSGWKPARRLSSARCPRRSRL
jgi:hypothetical protein